MCQFKEGMWERDGVREGAMRRKVRTQIFREGGGIQGKVGEQLGLGLGGGIVGM